MANVITATLGQIANLAAEKSAFGQPDWSVVNTTTAASLTATVAGVANIQHFLEHLVVSFSTAPTATGVNILDGTATIATYQVGPGMTFPWVLDLSGCPLRASVGASLNITMGSTGTGCVQTITAIGYDNMIQATVT